MRWAWRARGGRGDIKREFRKKKKSINAKSEPSKCSGLAISRLRGLSVTIDGSTARRCIAIVTNERRASYVIPLNSS